MSPFLFFLLSLAELGPFLLFDHNSRHFYCVPRPTRAHESTIRIAILLQTRGVSFFKQRYPMIISTCAVGTAKMHNF